jgi:hypothetical protein
MDNIMSNGLVSELIHSCFAATVSLILLTFLIVFLI